MFFVCSPFPCRFAFLCYAFNFIELGGGSGEDSQRGSALNNSASNACLGSCESAFRSSQESALMLNSEAHAYGNHGNGMRKADSGDNVLMQNSTEHVSDGSKDENPYDEVPFDFRDDESPYDEIPFEVELVGKGQECTMCVVVVAVGKEHHGTDECFFNQMYLISD